MIAVASNRTMFLLPFCSRRDCASLDVEFLMLMLMLLKFFSFRSPPFQQRPFTEYLTPVPAQALNPCRILPASVVGSCRGPSCRSYMIFLLAVTTSPTHHWRWSPPHVGGKTTALSRGYCLRDNAIGVGNPGVGTARCPVRGRARRRVRVLILSYTSAPLSGGRRGRKCCAVESIADCGTQTTVLDAIWVEERAVARQGFSPYPRVAEVRQEDRFNKEQTMGLALDKLQRRPPAMEKARECVNL